MGLFSRTRKAPPPPTTVVPWESLGVTFRPTLRGESHYQPELRAMLRLSQSWTALLLRQPDNKFDTNAVAVHIEGQCVAHLAKPEAAELAPSSR